LATVSGGGYIGGWWTAWRNRRPRPRSAGATDGTGQFPVADDGGEPPEVRHLREFGNFLVPRIGFLESETWNSLVAVLGGLIPSLIVATAVLACLWLGWLFLLFHVVWRPDPWIGSTTTAALTVAVLVVAEWSWRRRGKGDRDRIANGTYMVCSIL